MIETASLRRGDDKGGLIKFLSNSAIHHPRSLDNWAEGDSGLPIYGQKKASHPSLPPSRAIHRAPAP